MPTAVLSITVYRLGSNAYDQLSWALAIHDEGADRGILFRTIPKANSHLNFQMTIERDVHFRFNGSYGSFSVAHLTKKQIAKATTIISKIPGLDQDVSNSQEWALQAVSSLELQQLISEGTADWVFELKGKTVEDVAELVGPAWVFTVQHEDNN